MAKNVFILGAGASKDAGAPLMSEFLDKAEEIYRNYKFLSGDDPNTYTNDDEGKYKHFQNVFDAIPELNKVHTKSYLDLDNIEVLFGVVEMAVLIKRLSDYEPDRINDLKNSLIQLIVKTLEKSIMFQNINNDNFEDKKYMPSPYDKFIELLIVPKVITYSTVITFNYDLCMDYAISTAGQKINYCLNDDDERKDGYKLLKLHGSVNWRKCTGEYNGKIFPLDFDTIPLDGLLEDYKDPKRNLLEKYKILNLNEYMQQEVHPGCKIKGCLSTPVIVPPTWNKTEYHGNLTNVWSSAAKELSEAENIFIIGYSLPETDSFFKYLYALGTIGSERIKRFWVFNPDATGEVEARYKRMIGQGIQNRFKYKMKTFKGAIEEIREIKKELY
jgi:hypothetical protein